MTSMSEIAAKASKLPPADTDVQLPAAIRAAAARANAAHAEQYNAAPAAETGADPNAQAQPEATPQATPEATPEGATPEAPAQGDNWEQKYRSVKGRFDRQEDTIRQLNSRIASMEGMLARQPAPVQQQVRTNENTFKTLTSEEREAYGDDFIDVAARAAQEKLNPEIVELQRKIDELSGKVGSVAERAQVTTQTQMNQYLDGNLENWRVINRDPKFIAWTNLPDPFSGAIRINMLKDAYAQGDAPRVLRFFNGYLADEAATTPVPGAKPELPSGKVPLETFAAPGRAKAPATSEVPVEKETITQAQISQFYLNVQKGMYRGNDEEKNRLEAMIFAAQAEGRIV